MPTQSSIKHHLYTIQKRALVLCRNQEEPFHSALSKDQRFMKRNENVLSADRSSSHLPIILERRIVLTPDAESYLMSYIDNK